MRVAEFIKLISEDDIAIDALSDYEVVCTCFWKRRFYIGPLKRINISERSHWNGKIVRKDNQIHEMKIDTEDDEITLICRYLENDKQPNKAGLNFTKFYDQLFEQNKVNPDYDVVSSYWIKVEFEKKKAMRFDIPIMGFTFDHEAKKVMLLEK